jgi:chromosome segregation ATPase
VSFDYDKSSGKSNEHGSWWTSYADLFMMLSIVFLLMYVASNLRSGSAGYQQQAEYKKLARHSQDLEEQIKVYNTLKDETLRKQSSESEQQVYTKLMDKLSLLKDEAKGESIALREKAKENEEKEFALNQYQQLIRNIINTNILAKNQIAHRDQLIVTKDATIVEKKQEITEMEQVIAQNKAQIAQINSQLDNRIQELREEQRRSRSSKAVLEHKIAALRNESETQIATLEQKNHGISAQLSQVQSNLVETSNHLSQTTEQLGQANQTIEQKKQEVGQLASKLEAEKARDLQEMDALKRAHDGELASERAAFDAKMKQQQLSAAQRAQQLAKFLDGEKQKAAELAGKLAGLRDKVADTESKLAGTQNALQGTQQKLAGTESQLAGTQNVLQGTQQKLAGAQNALQGTQQKLAGAQDALQGTKQKLAGAEAEKGRALAAVEGLKDDLERTRAIANVRKELAKKITEQFNKSGLHGAVDARTGEVTLDFGGEYFDTGSSSLKPKMRTTLDKFMPVYARSLFNDPKIADKIASVEIIGFASSTYQGRYVNPKSTRAEDKDAIDYNLKLSFGRANSIFSHVINQNDLSAADRDKLMPLLKVVGRGYLPDGKSASDMPDHMTEKQFCERYNCKAAQKVIVKFNMKD